MCFDFRVFLGENFDRTQHSASDLLRVMDHLEIEKALVCPLKPLSYDLNEANSSLAHTVRSHPDRFYGAARIDPWQPAAPDRLRWAFEIDGLHALFLHPWEENFRADMLHLDKLLEVCAQFHRPVLVASGYPWVSEALQVLKLALRWPVVPVVMSNGGQINISGLGQADVTLALSQAANLYYDTAGTYRQDFIEETIATFGAERVLFGSGTPFFDQRFEIQRVQLAKISDAERHLVLRSNAARLLAL